MNKEMIDVLTQLEVKNREIYTNKLNIDIENNKDILTITINNITNLFNQDIPNKIQEIISSTFKKDDISKAVSNFNIKLKDKLIKLIEQREIELKNKIKDIDNIDYQKEINDESLKIIDKIKEYYITDIDNLITTINNYNLGEEERIIDYLKNYNFNKYINKIKESILNTDNILYNNYQESLDRFEELQENTVFKV